MQGYDAATQALIEHHARTFGISDAAVAAMLEAVRRGQGSMAQFNIPELGGGGQWMLGGMTMVGDMFNHGLKVTVDQLCLALSQALQSGQIPAESAARGEAGGTAWPAELGVPSSVGGQNDSAYAVFPSTRRLAIREGNRLTVYDTGEHAIFGVGQQQGGTASLTFTSQYGTFSVASLRRVSGDPAEHGGQDARAAAAVSVQPPSQGAGADRSQSRPQSSSAKGLDDEPVDPGPAASHAAVPAAATDAPAAPLKDREPAGSDLRPASAGASTVAQADGLQIITLIEKLAALRQAGVLTEDEFSAKKAELLARL